MAETIMFNGDGMPVPKSPLEIEKELLNGTGSVMADGVAIYVEHLNVSENQYVVVKSPEKNEPPETKRFPSANYDAAWRQFLSWLV